MSPPGFELREDCRDRRASLNVCFVLSHASINRCRLRIAVPENLLERECVDARAIKMSAEGMLGAVRIPTARFDARAKGRILEDLGDGITRNSTSRAVDIITPAIRVSAAELTIPLFC